LQLPQQAEHNRHETDYHQAVGLAVKCSADGHQQQLPAAVRVSIGKHCNCFSLAAQENQMQEDGIMCARSGPSGTDVMLICQLDGVAAAAAAIAAAVMAIVGTTAPEHVRGT
jgi:hypothetical protein